MADDKLEPTEKNRKQMTNKLPRDEQGEVETIAGANRPKGAPEDQKPTSTAGEAKDNDKE